MKYLQIFVLCLSVLISCKPDYPQTKKAVKTGAHVLLDAHLEELKGKRIGLVMNPTSRVNGVHMVDTLLSLGVEVTALFAPEHGFRGEAGAGEVIENGIDQETGLPVFSLYGKTRKPTPEMLEKVDILLLDLPDVGLRFYTYNSTMGLVLEATAENNKELWILDRPDPLGGDFVSGWTLEERYKSFVGSYPVPTAYGLTMGELAKMAVGEGWLRLDKQPNLKIIKAEGWKRSTKWPGTGLEWVPPSPNLPTFEHLFAYAGSVIFEGTNISEGRGTPDPFLMIGSPTVKFTASELSAIEKEFSVQLDSVSFIPRSIPGKSISPKYEGEPCFGIKISFNGEYNQTDPVKLGIRLLEFMQAHTSNFEIKSFANKLSGINLQKAMEMPDALPSWKEGVARFREKRKPYLLY
jgi:uncharacterized protein YbbC (DUF1343 family)